MSIETVQNVYYINEILIIIRAFNRYNMGIFRYYSNDPLTII
jgi:hypothetical protein